LLQSVPQKGSSIKILDGTVVGVVAIRTSKIIFARRNKTALGPRGQAETSLKIEDMRSNKTTIDVI